MLPLEENNIIKIIIELLEGNKIQIIKLQRCSSEDFLFVGGQLKNNSVNDSGYQSAINAIIKELQFHDIMRQKLEHVEAIDDLLLKELKQRLTGHGGIIFSSVIPEITSLNVAQ